jgi:hypothetical protein
MRRFPLQRGAQEIFIQMTFVAQRKIEIFRKPVCLEITFFKTGAAFKDPVFGEVVMGVDAGEQPAEDVVLFYDAGKEAEGRCGFEELAPVDHGLPVQ